ncbi:MULTISPECIES: spore germination protein [Clostridium]|uniref:Spore germination protein, GerA n=1 Tax=Clostridium botulinum (strain Eklund 17B / Type B) TaxID=935198 RepID=B2TQ97_CLOBB|nr:MULTISPECIES: spore germination protein [Clostridium]ACD21730.1 spore germination protein, GerA [Clostridium botulinum B str. Eklund 17B (NRP)]MBN1039746.1 spore germination protein [Clostridium botulinum]MBN1046601.1 spore germination protein [Clostridium botulinum]MBN1068997.1 spore germination protein [Clostridium botulinum]MBY6975536.1 spore germination protein [Clostridium botulinum]
MNENLNYFKKRFEKAFDVKYRDVDTKLGKATLVFIDTLCNSQFISDYIVSPLKNYSYECNTLDDIVTKVLEINIVGNAKDLEDAVLHILSGDIILTFENEEKMIFCEVKGFPTRGISIPVTESVVKGPREGFNELFVNSISLIRRKIKNSDLKFEPLYVGEKSQTVVCLCYIEGVAPEYLVNEIKETINNLHLDFILDTNYIEAKLRKKDSLFDTVGYTEKPDEVAAKIMEGRVAVLVDGTPFVLTIPYFFLENFQTPDDYYLNRLFVNFLRILRWIAFFLATFMPGLYIAVVTHHFSLLTPMFTFRLAVARAGVPFPTVFEVIIMMIAFQLIKEAGLRLPQPIGGAMSIVSALILGDAAVGAGIASRITIIIVALSTLSYFLIPKIYGAISIWSIGVVILSAFFGLPGFFMSFIILLSNISDLETGGYSFLFPIATDTTYKFRDTIFRGRLSKISKTIIGKEKK